jgi:hypothetical protein
MACYGDSFTFVYVHDVRTSQETPIGLHVLTGIITTIIITGTTALCELWPSSGFLNNLIFTV